MGATSEAGIADHSVTPEVTQVFFSLLCFVLHVAEVFLCFV